MTQPERLPVSQEASDTLTWKAVVEPLVARFDVAANFNCNAVHNPEGSRALAELLRSMAEKLDMAASKARALLSRQEAREAAASIVTKKHIADAILRGEVDDAPEVIKMQMIIDRAYTQGRADQHERTKEAAAKVARAIRGRRLIEENLSSDIAAAISTMEMPE